MTEKEKNLGGRAYLVSKLINEAGLSRRKATEIVNVILERMIAALKQDCEVEFPYGRLVRVERSVTQRWSEADGRCPYWVEWQLDRAGARELGRM
ncbi:MAG: HU family DNA-binding protein [Terracidiphilus sp.]